MTRPCSFLGGLVSVKVRAVQARSLLLWYGELFHLDTYFSLKVERGQLNRLKEIYLGLISNLLYSTATLRSTFP